MAEALPAVGLTASSAPALRKQGKPKRLGFQGAWVCAGPGSFIENKVAGDSQATAILF